MRVSWILVFLLCCAYAAQATVYRVIDAQGNITFTDEAPKPGEQYEKVDISPPNVVPMEVPTVVTAPPPASNAASPYRSFSITSPANDSAVRENAGNVDVSLNIAPALNAPGGHRVVVLMDGASVAQGSELNYRLLNVDRGTHELQAEVKNASGERIALTQPVTFTLQRID